MLGPLKKKKKARAKAPDSLNAHLPSYIFSQAIAVTVAPAPFAQVGHIASCTRRDMLTGLDR